MEDSVALTDAFSNRIADYRDKVDKAISAELNQYRNSVFYIPLKNALKQGKRIRPILLILSSETVNKQGVNPFPAAVAVELAHMESLIHDDIIDRDHLRRGQLAFHDSYGYEMALLSADFLLSMILEITSRSADPRIAETLAQETCRMCEGELEEIRVCKSGHEIGMDEYIGIISKKTASLFEASAKIGAIIGGAQEHEIEALSSYGKHLGIAYQIRDDITDLKKKPFNILNLLGVHSDKVQICQEKLDSYIFCAKENLEILRASQAKNLLADFTDFVRSYSDQ